MTSRKLLFISLTTISLVLNLVACDNNNKTKIKQNNDGSDPKVEVGSYGGIDIIKNELRKYKVDFNTPLFNQSSIIKNDNTIINSNNKFDLIWTTEKLWEFPFVWDPIAPVEAFPILLYKINNFYVIIIAYGYGSTGTYSYENYLFTYSVSGNFIDMVNLPQFNYGKGDASIIAHSNFTKTFGTAGFSEIKASKSDLFFNSANLTLYNNGTEEVNLISAEYKISDLGIVKNIVSDSSHFYFFRNGKINSSMNGKIKKYSN